MTAVAGKNGARVHFARGGPSGANTDSWGMLSSDPPERDLRWTPSIPDQAKHWVLLQLHGQKPDRQSIIFPSTGSMQRVVVDREKSARLSATLAAVPPFVIHW